MKNNDNQTTLFTINNSDILISEILSFLGGSIAHRLYKEAHDTGTDVYSITDNFSSVFKSSDYIGFLYQVLELSSMLRQELPQLFMEFLSPRMEEHRVVLATNIFEEWLLAMVLQPDELDYE